MGNLCFMSALIAPMCMYEHLNTTDGGNMIRFDYVIGLGIANAAYILLIAFTLYVLV